MKRSKVFVIPVVLLLFVLLPNMLHAAQEGIGQHIVADHTGNGSYRSHMDPIRRMMEKGVGNPRQWPEAPRYPIQGRDGMMDRGIKDPANHAFHEKRPDRKSDAENTSADTWKLVEVDGKSFTHFYPRAIAVDASHHPHITYGDGHLYYAYHDGSTWHYQTVDASSGVGSYASIALDTSGKVHISYFDNSNRALKYATNGSGSWVTTTVDSNLGYFGGYTSIALDTSGKAHISYLDNTNFYLKYATNASGSWVTTTVDSDGYADKYTSIAVDASGKAHISYLDNTNFYLKYATNATGSWVTTTVDSNIGYWGGYTSITLDASGKVHISYYDGSNGDLKYATNGSGSWVTTTVDSSGDVGYYTSIALDASGKVHISYFDGTNADLKYATNATGSWITTTVDSGGDVGEYTAIALDASGKVHISYFDGTNADLKYVTNATGSWVTTTVDSVGDSVGEYTSIAVDTSGKVHISYFDRTNADLKYATNATGSWVTTTVDSSGDVGYYTAIALDASGKVHISYFDGTNSDLKYVTNATGSWVTTTVDSGGQVGYYTSIALDASGKVHISYFDGTNSDLKYVTNATGSWVTTTVDSCGDVGEYTSIALDASGKVHVSYLDYTNAALKYATNASGSWVTTTVDRSGDSVDKYTSIAVDGAGNAHISYNYTVGFYLDRDMFFMYATNASGTWVTTTVEGGHSFPKGTGLVGLSASIAVDISGKVHISYFDWTDDFVNDVSFGSLRYATNCSGDWVATTVDSIPGVGEYTSIALDTSGKVHISYYAALYNHDLMYATNAINKPTVKTKSATHITDYYSTLNGIVNGHGLTTRVWFQYGTASGSYNAHSSKRTVKGSKNKKVHIVISGLSSQTTYYYRIAARNKDGTSYGEEKSFTTQ